MTDRLLDFSESAAHLHVRDARLIVERSGIPDASVPLVDVAAVVVSHPRVTFSQAALAGLAAAGGTFVVCDDKHLPAGMLLPVAGHYVQTERFLRQAQVSQPTRKRLWRQLVRSKIRAQAAALRELHGDDAGLPGLVARVKSGDPQNVEAQASRRYWPRVFGNTAFRRRREAEDQNRHLNYGYAVLRAVVARAICAAGLHPTFGLHHRNRYDAFCLADDLMEPFRPMVDVTVAGLVRDRGADVPMDREAKATLLNALTGRMLLDGEERTLFDVLGRTASSLVAALAGERKTLVLPEW